ncbi:EpsG family protein [Erysipelothrix anatis]|uniref:EpsG family protein n=1 Tax=Erysipelothrix anatis TaxID=2683713 RepID=UPI001357216F|nr:EpsG family protein [Erysipelothrix anatis]
MVIYIVLATALASFLIVDSKSTKVNSIAIFSFMGILFFLSAFRFHTVGADTGNYLSIFRWIRDLNFFEIHGASLNVWYENGTTEYVYKVLNWIFSKIIYWEQSILIFCSLITYVLMYRTVTKQSKNALFSVYLFVVFGMFQMSMNLMPSSLAAMIWLNSLYELSNSNYLIYGIKGIIATGIHNSSIFYFVLLIYKKIRISFRMVNFTIFGSIIFIFIAMGPFVSLIGHFLPAKYVVYLTPTQTRWTQLIVLIVQLSVLYPIMYANKNNPIFWEKYKVSILSTVIVIASYIFSLRILVFARVAFMFSPVLILALPNMILDDEINHITYSPYMITPRDRQRMIVLWLLALYIARLLVNNIGKTVPYISIF